MKKELDYNHFGGFDFHGTTLSTTPNQLGSANVTEVGVSGLDGLYSSSFDVHGIDGRFVNMIFSSPKPSKRKSCYNRGSKEKKRFIWTVESHQCFLQILNGLPEDKRKPKYITAEMVKTYPEITREIVASHLQKHRLNIKKKENNKAINSAKPSSKQGNNVHQFQNGTEIVLNSSTNPNPNPNSQNYFFSNYPIPQSQSFSINNSFHNPSNIIPNSQFPQNETTSQLHLSDNLNTVPVPSSTLEASLKNDLVNSFGTQNIYPVGVILGQSSNGANNSQISTPTNNIHQLVTEIDGYGYYGYNVFDHIMDYNSNFEYLNNDNDYSLFHILNFNNEYNHLSLIQDDGFNNSQSLQFNHEFQVNYSQQGSQSKLSPPADNQVDNYFILP